VETEAGNREGLPEHLMDERLWDGMRSDDVNQ
jgi:hypothetical protein